MKRHVEFFKPLLCLFATIICFSQCGNEASQGLSYGSKFMRLTSDYTEIAIDSAKVPGYWAGQVGDGERFFLYSLDRSFKKGDVITVDGAFGTAAAAVFDDATRVYQREQPTNVFVVWKAAMRGPGNHTPPPSRGVRGK
ncbi:MAG: hypothetical protein ACXVJK_08300 [Candidatus Aminicenantales bacterium]